MKRILLTLGLLYFGYVHCNAQISQGGIPFTWQATNLQIIPEVNQIEPTNQAKSDIYIDDKSGALEFAYVIDVTFDADKHGKWYTLSNNDRLWILQLKSPGAFSINLTFSRYLIPEGGKVFIYNADRTFKLGAFTADNNKSYGSLAIAPIKGDEILIEYYQPADADFQGELIIGSVGHDYKNVFNLTDGQYGASGDCNIDINCESGKDWQNEKRSVARIITNNSRLCSGSLINNATNDQTPYFITANHCISTQEQAQNSVFFFNYESPNCNGSDGSISQTISGSDLVATKNKNLGYLDFTLLKLSTNVPLTYNPYFAGWDSRQQNPLNGSCIHHPWGDVKKISLFTSQADQASYTGFGYDPNAFWRVNHWSDGTTEGGSSGSPLFDQNKRMVGMLSGGEASCSVDSCDYFQALSVAYEKYSDNSMQLKHWLDPNNSGINYLDGLDTYINPNPIGNQITVAHWEQGQNLALYIANEGGFLAGNNIYGDIAKAEYFSQTEFGDRNAITGAYIAFGYATGNDNELVELQVLQENNGTPSTLLGSSYVKLQEIKSKADKDYVYYSFNPAVEINSSIFLSLVLPQNAGDTVAIMTLEEAEINTGWELNSDYNWFPYNNTTYSWGIDLAHIIALEIGKFTALTDNNSDNLGLTIFPNPANESTTFSWDNSFKAQTICLYNQSGQLIYNKPVTNLTNAYTMDISALPAGLYLLMVNGNNQFIKGKLMKN